MTDPANIAAVFADENKMRELVRNIEKIRESMDRMAEKLAGAERSVPALLDRTKEGTKDVNDSLKDTLDYMKDMAEMSEGSLSTLEKYGERLTGIFKTLGSTIKAAVEGAGKLGLGLMHNPEAMLTQGVGAIPTVGPILQMALESQFREDRFKTAGRQAGLQFQQTSNLDPSKVRQVGAGLGADIKRLEESFLATGHEVNAVWAAYASGGAKADDVTKKLTFGVKGFGNTVGLVSLGLDKAFGMAAGTSASFAQTLRQETNVALEESVALIRDMGVAAHDTGMTSQAFIGTITQVTSAFRVQGGDARDLSKAYFEMKNTLAGAAGIQSDSARAGVLGAEALKGVPQALQAMPEGLKALIGQRLGFGKGIESLRTFATGGQFDGKGGHFEQRVMTDEFAFAAEKMKTKFGDQGSEAKLFQFLTKIEGMPALLAEAMIRSKGQLFSGGEGMSKALTDYQKNLDKTQALVPLNKGDFEAMMEKIKQVMFAIGQATVALLGGLVSAVVGGFEMMGRALANPHEAGALAASYGRSIGRSTARLGKSLGAVADRAGEAGGPLKQILNDFTGRDEDTAENSMFLTKEDYAKIYSGGAVEGSTRNLTAALSASKASKAKKLGAGGPSSSNLGVAPIDLTGTATSAEFPMGRQKLTLKIIPVLVDDSKHVGNGLGAQ